MSFTEKRLCNPTQLTTSGQTLYTVPASKTAIVKQIVVTNVTGSAATFSLFIGAAATPNALFSATSVAANDAIVINLSQVLNSTEILTALASANSTLNITISGVENDGPLNPLSTYIADGAITTAKLADSSVTSSKFASNVIIPPSLIDAKGDLLVGTADNTVNRFSVGSNQATIKADSSQTSGIRWGFDGVPIFASNAARDSAIPSPTEGTLVYTQDKNRYWSYNGSSWTLAGGRPATCIARMVSADSITLTGSVQYVALADEIVDTDDLHSTTTNNSRITIPSGSGLAGMYHVYGLICINYVTAPDIVAATIYVNRNGNTANVVSQAYKPWATFGGTVQASGWVWLNEGDYIELGTVASGGSSVTLLGTSTGSGLTHLRATWMSPRYDF